MAAVPGRFDNRSISFPTDFPSANFLLAHGVERVVLVQTDALQPQADLAHTLRRWQEGGIEIAAKALAQPEAPVVCMVARPSRFRNLWYRLLATGGLKANPLGGFGGMLTESGAG